jgi:hypothetical protein
MINFKNATLTLLLAFAIVSFWRGIWGLMDLYLLPNNPSLSFSLSAVIGIGIIYSVKHKINILV